MSTQLERDFDTYPPFFQRNLSHYYRSILSQFRKIVQSFALFHLTFWLLITLEVVTLALSLPLYTSTPLFPISLGALFLTASSYLILRFYFQERKPEQFEELKNRFLASCRTLLSSDEGEHHLSLAMALTKLSLYFDDYEWNFYRLPPFLSFLEGGVSRLSASLYWRDLFDMKVLLLEAAIEEHLAQIRSTPTDLEVHASLAQCYISLSQVYRSQKGRAERKGGALFEEKFRESAKLAMEEFHILSHYAPNDPWVHEQLAAGYRTLEMAQEEVKEVECLLKLRPQDKEILFRLGKLYFEQGQNAKGLQVYEELSQAHYKRAEELISSYGKRATLSV